MTTRACARCNEKFSVFPEDLAFYSRVSPVIRGELFLFPPPLQCPECRKRHRLSFHNDMQLYHRKSSLSKKQIISIYNEAVPFPVYDHEEWWSDTWDATAYGKAYNFDKPFFEQFKELLDVVPRPSIYATNCENCVYCFAANCKNCYLIGGASYDEECYYSYRINYSTRCCDCLLCWRSELCYECTNVRESYNCSYCTHIAQCVDSYFLFDCTGCHACTCCTGLRNEKYCLFNQRYTRQEYERRVTALELSTWKGVQSTKQTFLDFLITQPQRATQLRNTEDVIGDTIRNAKKCFWVFDGEELEDVRYGQFVSRLKDCQDVNWGFDAELQYQVCTTGLECYNVAFCIDTWPSVHDLYYCAYCQSGTAHCFGSVGLKKNEYCILNRQYSKDDYEAILPEIIQHMQKNGEWGEFFPASLSSFGYNETVAQDYFPCSKEEANTLGFAWYEAPTSLSTTFKIISGQELPDAWDLERSIPSEYAIRCSVSEKLFRFTKQELEFYEQQHIPLPHHHPLYRHRARNSARNPRKLWRSGCVQCGELCDTSYPPESRALVYCERCYQR